LIKKNNTLLNEILLIPIIVIIFISFIFLYTLFKVEQFSINSEIMAMKSSYLNSKKKFLKSKIDFFIRSNLYDIHEATYSLQEIRDKYNSKKFKTNDYIFVYKVLNLNKKKFAVMIINPNRLDLIGKPVSVDKKDINGFEYRKEMVKQIKQKGEAFVIYSYKKPDSDTISKKLSYFKYIPKLKEIVATGIYLDDIDKELQKQITLIKTKHNEITFKIIISVFIVISLFIIFLWRKLTTLKNILRKYSAEIENKNIELIKLNNGLETKIKKAVSEVEARDEIILQNSRNNAINEILNMIGHQWRQPLNVISLNLTNIELEFELNKDNKTITYKDIEPFVNKSNKVIQQLSKNITEFQKLFNKNIEKHILYLDEILSNIFTLYKDEFIKNEIEFNLITKDRKLKVDVNKQDIVQSIFNLLTNSKEVLIEKNIQNKIINMIVYKKNNQAIIEIEDNGGGIDDEKIFKKLFEPYFSTKNLNTRGLGLFRTKLLLKNNGATIKAINGINGLKIVISIPIVK